MGSLDPEPGLEVGLELELAETFDPEPGREEGREGGREEGREGGPEPGVGVHGPAA